VEAKVVLQHEGGDPQVVGGDGGSLVAQLPIGPTDDASTAPTYGNSQSRA
jgi:hypothetical protein